MNESNYVICNWCNQLATIIWVHGHGQCSICGVNIDECCKVEEANSLTSSLLVAPISNEDDGERKKEEKSER